MPSIVYGILGLVVFVQALRAFTGPDTFGRSYISGGLTLSVLVLPIIILVTMEARGPCPRACARPPTGWEHPVGGRAQPRAAVRRAWGLHGLDPVDGSGLRGDGATAAGGGRHRLPVHPSSATPLEVLQGKYTALPTQIYSWSRLAGEDWKANTAAAIVVLLVIILVVNLAAILLRNRYDRKW